MVLQPVARLSCGIAAGPNEPECALAQGGECFSTHGYGLEYQQRSEGLIRKGRIDAPG